MNPAQPFSGHLQTEPDRLAIVEIGGKSISLGKSWNAGSMPWQIIFAIRE